MKHLTNLRVLILVVSILAHLTIRGVSSGKSENSFGQSSTNALPDLSIVPADLITPAVTDEEPAPGRRVKQTLPEYKKTGVYHALYLPIDWKKGGRYPVIVEYPGNGPYRSEYGDLSTGQVDGCDLGYGISAGKRFIWISLPFVNTADHKNQLWWWGDVQATIDYCKKAVLLICQNYGGDPAAIFLAGFSRGAIACNYIGLHDDEIADIWLAFIPYSHYDGVREWNYADSDKQAALVRLKRIRGRASFITQEGSIEDIRQYISSTGVSDPFKFMAVNFRNHNDAWVLRDSPVRQKLRQWMFNVLEHKPGVYSLSGRVADRNGMPVSGVYICSGWTHFTLTDKNGRYRLPGLITSEHRVSASKGGCRFRPGDRLVDVSGKNIDHVDFSASCSSFHQKSNRIVSTQH